MQLVVLSTCRDKMNFDSRSALEGRVFDPDMRELLLYFIKLHEFTRFQRILH